MQNAELICIEIKEFQAVALDFVCIDIAIVCLPDRPFAGHRLVFGAIEAHPVVVVCLAAPIVGMLQSLFRTMIKCFLHLIVPKCILQYYTP